MNYQQMCCVVGWAISVAISIPCGILVHRKFGGLTYYPGWIILGDFPAHTSHYIGKTPGSQLGCLYGNGNRAPGNIFIYQSKHPFLWDKLSRSVVIAPAPPFSGAAVLPPARNGL